MGSNKERRLRRKVRRSYTISTVSIALVLFMLGAVSYVTLSALSVAASLRENVVVSVELEDGLAEADSAAVKQALEAHPSSASVLFMSKDEKLADEEFRRQFELAIDELLAENPLRDSYEVTLCAEASTREGIESLRAAVEDVVGVAYVAAPPVAVVDKMDQTIPRVSIALLIFLAVLLFISVLLLNNTVRLAIYSKRYLINTMKLVGATKWYIMRPLLASAFKQGIVAGVIAALLLCLAIYGVESFTPQGIAMLPYREAGIIAGSMLLLGIFITVLFSALAVNKFVNMKSNKIHLY